MKTNLYKNLEVQFNKIFRHLKTGSFKTRERYAKAEHAAVNGRGLSTSAAGGR